MFPACADFVCEIVTTLISLWREWILVEVAVFPTIHWFVCGKVFGFVHDLAIIWGQRACGWDETNPVLMLS